MTDKDLRLTKGIHNLERGNLSWEKSWKLLSEVVESEEWIKYWEMEVLLNEYFDK